jgi:hypothetical protein
LSFGDLWPGGTGCVGEGARWERGNGGVGFASDGKVLGDGHG